MLTKLKKELILMACTGVAYILLKALDVQTPGIKKVIIILQMITLILYVFFTIKLMVKSQKV